MKKTKQGRSTEAKRGRGGQVSDGGRKGDGEGAGEGRRVVGRGEDGSCKEKIQFQIDKQQDTLTVEGGTGVRRWQEGRRRGRGGGGSRVIGRGEDGSFKEKNNFRLTNKKTHLQRQKTDVETVKKYEEGGRREEEEKWTASNKRENTDRGRGRKRG